MNGDQRPGRVRLFSSERPQEAHPRRRRGDWPEGGREEAVLSRTSDVDPAGAAARKPRSSPILQLFLFGLGSAAGGALVAALGLFKVPGL
jgi:hypothetical protein